jgi:hypothetical protein
MAKETKQDRIVRQVVDHMDEHLHELKALESNPNLKELEVERWAQTLLKSCLGYSATSGYSIRAQEQKGKNRPDLVIYQNEKVIFVMEVKKLGFNLDKSDFRSGKVQLQEYLYSLGNVPYGILCNGYEWRLYDFNNSLGPVEIFSIDLRGEDGKLDVSKKIAEDICYDIFGLHESSFSSGEWSEFSKEATAFSPESLTKAILSSSVVKLITKEIRGEHEFKASTDILYDKIFDLLEKGLDDSLKDYKENSVKRDEFKKYIRSQMRASRKVKKVSKTLIDSSISEPLANANTSITDTSTKEEIKKDAA